MKKRIKKYVNRSFICKNSKKFQIDSIKLDRNSKITQNFCYFRTSVIIKMNVLSDVLSLVIIANVVIKPLLISSTKIIELYLVDTLFIVNH